MRRLVRSLLIATACLALPAGAQAANPFTAGSGGGPGVAVGSDGSGHIVWETDAANTQVGYCRVASEATSCNRTEILSFPARPKRRVPAKRACSRRRQDKVVIVAGCWNLPDRDSESDLSLDLEQQRRQLRRSAGNRDRAGNERRRRLARRRLAIFVGASAANVKAALVDGEFGVQFASGGLFVYGPEVVRLQGTTKLVAASNDLEVVKYGVFKGGHAQRRLDQQCQQLGSRQDADVARSRQQRHSL